MELTAVTELQEFAGLPGDELIRPGLASLAAGLESAETLLIEIAQSRLRLAGLPIPRIPLATIEPELRLYALLNGQYGNEAHYHYNSLTARLEKFCRSCEQRLGR